MGRKHLGQLKVIDCTEVYEERSEAFAGRRLLKKGFRELAGADQLLVDKEVADPRRGAIPGDGEALLGRRSHFCV
jgi:hypothetical protein